MKFKLLVTVAMAASVLGGCATYEQAGAHGPGGYYQGRPQVRYYGGYSYGYPYDYYGGYGYYGGGPYRYANPYYGYYGPYYPYYRPHNPPPRPGHGHDRPNPPPGSGPGGNRPAPWRDPTRGAWRDHGQQPMVPGQPQSQQQMPRSGRPSYQRPNNYQRPPRGMSAPGNPGPSQSMPRTIQRPASSAPAPRVQYRGGGRVKIQEP